MHDAKIQCLCNLCIHILFLQKLIDELGGGACIRFAVINIAAAGRIADMMIHIDRLFRGPEILFRIPEPFL